MSITVTTMMCVKALTVKATASHFQLHSRKCTQKPHTVEYLGKYLF